MEQKPEKQNSFMLKLATFIVDKRSLIFLIVIIGQPTCRRTPRPKSDWM